MKRPLKEIKRKGPSQEPLVNTVTTTFVVLEIYYLIVKRLNNIIFLILVSWHLYNYLSLVERRTGNKRWKDTSKGLKFYRVHKLSIHGNL